MRIHAGPEPGKALPSYEKFNFYDLLYLKEVGHEKDFLHFF
jgi:hypothetical protein